MTANGSRSTDVPHTTRARSFRRYSVSVFNRKRRNRARDQRNPVGIATVCGLFESRVFLSEENSHTDDNLLFFFLLEFSPNTRKYFTIRKNETHRERGRG